MVAKQKESIPSYRDWAVITANFGAYDLVAHAPNAPGADLVLVTDDLSVARRGEERGWRVVQEPVSEDTWLSSRRPKFEPYVYTDREHSVWIDARARFLGNNLLAWAKMTLKTSHIALFEHNVRQSIRFEAEELLRLKKAPPSVLDQVEQYLGNGYPDNDLPLLSGFLVIRHHSDKIVRFGDRWRHETTQWRTRDQISLPYCLWLENVVPEIIPGDGYSTEHYALGPHRRPTNSSRVLHNARLISFWSRFQYRQIRAQTSASKDSN